MNMALLCVELYLLAGFIVSGFSFLKFQEMSPEVFASFRPIVIFLDFCFVL